MVKDILRELKARKLQFFAILLITTLGVGFFIGIRVTGHDMRLTADAYMEDANVLDIKVMHSLGVDSEMKDELDEILEQKGYRLRSTPLYAESNKFDNVISVYEFNEATKDDLTILQGRLPVNKNEVFIDSMLFEVHDIKLFDEIKLKKNDIFNEASLEVVGIGQSSLFMNKSRGYTSLGSGDISGFVYGVGLDSKLEESTEIRYKFEADTDVKRKIKLLESKAEEISQARFDRAVAPELVKLDEAEIELEQAKIDGEKEIALQQAKIDEGRAELAGAKRQLEAGMNQLTFGFTLSTTDTLGQRLDLLQQNYAAAKRLAEASIDSLRIQIDAIEDTEVGKLVKVELGKQLDTQIQELDAMTSQFADGFAELEKGVAQYEQGVRELEAGQRELDEGKKTLNNEIATNRKKIADAREKIATTSTGDLYVFDRKDSIIGYKEFYDDSERIEAVGAVFPLIFFGVAVLVTLSTITRMVEESRMQLGVYKALGYTWFQASLKYVGFAAMAWGIGTFLGLIIGFYLLPNLIYNTYRILYETPPLVSRVVLKYLWIPVLVSFLSSVGVAFYKSIMVSRERGAQLLRPAMPQSGQRIFLERITPLWNRLGFLYKVSFRNLFRNKTRFLMTVIGIGGCAGLLITGFGLDHSVNSMIDLQFNEIMNYDGIIVYEPEAKIDNTLFDDYTNVFSSNITVNENDVTMYVAEDFTKFPEFFKFRNSKTKNEIEVYDDTVVISEKLALINDLKIGDSFKFKVDGISYESEVGAIIENYANHYLFMSQQAYEEISLSEVEMNMRMFKKADIPENFAETILKEEKILNVTLASGILDIFQEQMGNFSVIIYVVVIAAFLLELIVLSNLITMNISERKKELATLKVLGFYPMELAKYILRENITLTLIALILGGVFGVFLHKFVIITAELDMIMFNRQLNLFSVVISLVLTFVISVLINFIMSRKANDVDMSEALKTFDA
ncbi:MAG: FtsX-like permease family protein [Erysipelothrix sp.]|nr:FtsX-like permease family protein [Erysipelothrix sp.]